MQAHLSTIKKGKPMPKQWSFPFFVANFLVVCQPLGTYVRKSSGYYVARQHSALTSAKIQIMVLAHQCNTLHLLTVYSLSPQTRKYSIFYYALLESILSSWLLSMCIVTALDMALYCCFTQSVM